MKQNYCTSSVWKQEHHLWYTDTVSSFFHERVIARVHLRRSTYNLIRYGLEGMLVGLDLQGAEYVPLCTSRTHIAQQQYIWLLQSSCWVSTLFCSRVGC